MESANGVNALYRRAVWALAAVLVTVIGTALTWGKTVQDDHGARLRVLETTIVRVETRLQSMQDTVTADHQAILRAVRGDP